MSDGGPREGELRPSAPRRAARPPSRSQRLRSFLEAASRPKLFLAVFGPVFAIYLATASWALPASPDTFQNGLTAHAMAKDGTVWLDKYAGFQSFPAGMWIIDGEEGVISQYPPGAPAHAVPFYWLFGGETEARTVMPDPEEVVRVPADGPVDLEFPVFWPAALTAALVTALAMGFLALTFRELTTGPIAAGAAAVAAFGTSAWSVAADELWQHSPGVLWAAVAGFALARSHTSVAAGAYAIAIVVRPIAAAIAVGPTLVATVRRRWGSMFLLGVGVAVGIGAILAYNAAVFGEPSISGGYGGYRGELVSQRELTWFVANFATGLFHPRFGMLIWSPFLILLALGLPRAWAAAPDWARGPALGGALYLAGTWVLNRSSGGEAYWFYRYPLEPLTAAAPLLLVAYLTWVRGNAVRERLLRYGVIIGVVGHTMASFM